MTPALVITIVWVSIIAVTVSANDKRPTLSQKLEKKRNRLFLALETLPLGLIVLYHEENQNSYFLIAGTILLSIGWIEANNSILYRKYKSKKLRLWIRTLNSIFIGGKYTYFWGDWIQLFGLSLIWMSSISIFTIIIIYPLTVLILSFAYHKERNKKFENTDEFIRYQTHKDLLFLIGRHFILIIIPLSLWGVIQQDISIFSGSYEDAIRLITTLAQVEATLLALVIAFLFVLVEYTNSAYSPRLVKTFTNQYIFKSTIIFAGASILSKFFILTRPNSLLDAQNFLSNLLLDWSLLLTLLSTLSYFLFIKNTISFMMPETIANQILSLFNESWMNTVKRAWTSNSRYILRNFNLDDDPMILFERYLAKTIERKDTYSLITSLMIMEDRISQVMNKDDGGTIDRYLLSRLGNIINILGENSSDTGLGMLSGAVSEITFPSPKTLKTKEASLHHGPLGAQTLMKITEKAIEFDLTDSGRYAIFQLSRRCEIAIINLPSYANLWLYNHKNRNAPHPDMDELGKNDRRVRSVIEDYFTFFSKSAQRATKNNNAELVWALSHALQSKIQIIMKNISDTNYQWVLIYPCLNEHRKIIEYVCDNKLEQSISFIDLYDIYKNISDENIAILLSENYTKDLVLLAQAGILNFGHIQSFSSFSISLAFEYPRTALSSLEGLHSTGKSLGTKEYDKENGSFLKQEILKKIGQIEKAGRSKRGYKTKISIMAKKVRRDIKESMK